MSASLVGSEMCIRDSLSPCPRCAVHVRVLGLRKQSTQGASTWCEWALSVSYTHLTLPTICSV
eukprot:10545796-Alexandrium_andersonii.AAC.1